MNWVAVIPLKPPGNRKTRLATRLGPLARDSICDAMLNHVAETVAKVSRIERVELLCAHQPRSWTGHWRTDHGRGLNAELNAALDAHRSAILILHADLPLLDVADIDILLDAAELNGLAIAPDRHDKGTNALAIADGRALACRFGPDSLRRHRADAGRAHTIVRRTGLAFDCDTPCDLECVITEGADLFF